jgi:hypothetical protein
MVSRRRRGESESAADPRSGCPGNAQVVWYGSARVGLLAVTGLCCQDPPGPGPAAVTVASGGTGGAGGRAEGG